MPCIIIHLFVNSKLEGTLRILRVQKIGFYNSSPLKRKFSSAKIEIGTDEDIPDYEKK